MSELVLRDGDTRVELFRDFSAERSRLLASASERRPIALMQRDEWARSRPDAPSWLAATIDADGHCADAIALSVGRSRALPGHVILLGEHVRVGDPGDPARELTLRGLTEMARRSNRVLRLQLQFVGGMEHDGTPSADMTALGFTPATHPRHYRRTAVVDTTVSEDAIFSGLHKTARYNVRTATRRGALLEPVTDLALADRLEQLSDETVERTGGTVEPRDWASVVRLSTEHPDLSRLVGLFDPDVTGPQSLLSYAWGCFHGDHGQYYFAASSRETKKKISLGYAPVWDLIKWSKQQGGEWFDLGGITEESKDGSDPLGGISDFKRYFSSDVRAVATEWQLEPHRLRARVARLVASSYRGISRAFGR